MKKITMQNVADHANVSITSVSRYINQNGYVSEEKKELIENAMQELGYVLPTTHRNPRQKTIGHIIPRTRTSMYFDQLSGFLISASNALGYHSMIMQCDSDQISGSELLTSLYQLEDYRVNGIIIAGIADDGITDEVRAYLNHLDIPSVFVERTTGCSGFNRIEIDTRIGMVEAVRHLLECDHQNILYLDGHKSTNTPSKRLTGFLDGMKEFGSENTRYWIMHCKSNSPEDCFQKTAEAFGEHPEITAIIAWSDLIASSAMRYLYQTGKKIPDDVNIIGYDDILAPLLAPPISSIHMPLEEMSYAAVQIIADSDKKPLGKFSRTITIEPKLILR